MKSSLGLTCLVALSCVTAHCQAVYAPVPAARQDVAMTSSQPASTSIRRAQMLELVAYIDGVFAHRYALDDFKRQAFGWDRKVEIDKVRAAILAEPELSTHAFQRALFRFFRSMRDGHTDVVLAEDPAVVLGVRLRKVGDRYVLSCIDRRVLSADRFPYELGDEVTRLGDESVAEAIREAKEQTLNASTPGFEQALAELLLTLRTSREWDRLPTVGSALRLTLRKDGRGEETVQLPWVDHESAPQGEACPVGRGKESRIPALGTIRWRPEGARHYASYVFDQGGRSYGYLRFHTYALEEGLRREALAQLDETVLHFHELGVKKLVLDQTGNGGGDFPFAYTLFSRLTDKPLAVPQQRFLIHDARVVGFGPIDELARISGGLAAAATDEQAAQLMASHSLFAGPLDYLPKRVSTLRDVRGFLDFFERYASPNLQHRLTEPHYELVSGIEPARDVKPFVGPILMLIDEWNISAAEFAAAALQDAGRARLLGATSAGAGGDQRVVVADRVCGDSAPPLDGLTPCVPAGVGAAMKALGIRQFSYTVTLGVRATGQVIENRGVTPDLPVPATLADVQGRFGDLRERILSELTAM